MPSEVAPASPSEATPVVSVERGDAAALGESNITKGPILPVRIDFGSVLSRGWQIASQRYGLALAGSTLFLLLNLGSGMIANALSEGGRLAGDPVSIFFASHAGQILFDTWLSGGATIFFLKLTRGQTAQIGDLFSGGKYLNLKDPLFVIKTKPCEFSVLEARQLRQAQKLCLYQNILKIFMATIKVDK